MIGNLALLPMTLTTRHSLTGWLRGLPVFQFHILKQALCRLFECLRFGLQPLPGFKVNVDHIFQNSDPSFQADFHFLEDSKEVFRDVQTPV